MQTAAVKQQQHSLEEGKQKLREQQELVETEKRRLQQLAETLRKKSQQIQDTIHVCMDDIDRSMLQAISSPLHFMNRDGVQSGSGRGSPTPVGTLFLLVT